jgi:hypothetical protein
LRVGVSVIVAVAVGETVAVSVIVALGVRLGISVGVALGKGVSDACNRVGVAFNATGTSVGNCATVGKGASLAGAHAPKPSNSHNPTKCKKTLLIKHQKLSLSQC